MHAVAVGIDVGVVNSTPVRAFVVRAYWGTAEFARVALVVIHAAAANGSSAMTTRVAVAATYKAACLAKHAAMDAERLSTRIARCLPAILAESDVAHGAYVVLRDAALVEGTADTPVFRHEVLLVSNVIQLAVDLKPDILGEFGQARDPCAFERRDIAHVSEKGGDDVAHGKSKNGQVKSSPVCKAVKSSRAQKRQCLGCGFQPSCISAAWAGSYETEVSCAMQQKVRVMHRSFLG